MILKGDDWHLLSICNKREKTGAYREIYIIKDEYWER